MFFGESFGIWDLGLGIWDLGLGFGNWDWGGRRDALNASID